MSRRRELRRASPSGTHLRTVLLRATPRRAYQTHDRSSGSSSRSTTSLASRTASSASSTVPCRTRASRAFARAGESASASSSARSTHSPTISKSGLLLPHRSPRGGLDTSSLYVSAAVFRSLPSSAFSIAAKNASPSSLSTLARPIARQSVIRSVVAWLELERPVQQCEPLVDLQPADRQLPGAVEPVPSAHAQPATRLRTFPREVGALGAHGLGVVVREERAVLVALFHGPFEPAANAAWSRARFASGRLA